MGALQYREVAYEMLKDIRSHLEEDELYPSPELVDRAKKLVDKLFELSELQVHVDKTSLGDILVTVFNVDLDNLMIYCDSKGEADCRVTMNWKTKKRVFDSIDSLLNSTYLSRATRLLSSK
ncbi:MAG: hypothetical protein F4W92_08925 [Gammaproteobacteria bacterium]|nr:hypothetical protein [Gammaproteobacteria bacterium]